MEINIDDLHQVTEKLFQHLLSIGITSINFDDDYYWNIPSPQIYNPIVVPQELNLGQLSDDWWELRRILQSQKEPLGYDFVWLAAIYRAVGEHVLG